LNMAKTATKHPSVQLRKGIEEENFTGLGDGTDENQINLLNFNRLVAHAQIVAMNATAPEEKNPKALQHARQVAEALEGEGDSIGLRLSNGLSGKSDNALLNGFGDLALSNDTRMVGAQKTQKGLDVSYVGQQFDQEAATNLEISDAIKKNFTLPDNAIIKVGDKMYARGYYNFTNKVGLAGVPIPPGMQPHLISESAFQPNKAKGASFASLEVPPNSFRSGSNVTTRGALELQKESSSIVGAMQTTYPFAIETGYIEILNGPEGDDGVDSVDGPFGTRNTVLNHELLSPGIFVSGGLFSTDFELMEQWAAYNKAKAGGGGAGNQPSLKMIFDANGDKAVDGSSIKFKDDGTLDALQCMDINVTGNDPSTVNPTCAQMFKDGAFDKAFEGRGSRDSGDVMVCGQSCMCDAACICGDTRSCGARACKCKKGECSKQPKAEGLMAVECAKCKLQKLFWKCGDLFVSDCTETGLRTYEKGVELPWSPGNGTTRCVVSKAATIPELFNFVEQHSWDEAFHGKNGKNDQRSIIGRVREIKPEATEPEIVNLFGQPIKLGSRYFIWMKDPRKTRQLVITQTPPPGRKGQPDLDGTSDTKKSRSYTIVGTFVNPHYDNGTNDIMYREGPTSDTMVGSDGASWTPCTGFNNMLGRIQFSNKVTGNATGFCKPD
jgi:hypothetical protein